MISLLGRSQQIIQTGESCYFAFHKEMEEDPNLMSHLIPQRYQELEKKRHCMYLNNNVNDWECFRIKHDITANMSLIDVTIGSNHAVAPAFREINSNSCKDTKVKLRSEKWYD
jgi:hypothetical protein